MTLLPTVSLSDANDGRQLKIEARNGSMIPNSRPLRDLPAIQHQSMAKLFRQNNPNAELLG
jgi:hypothetical protein